MTVVGQRVGPGARLILLAAALACCAVALVAVPVASAATGSLETFERDPNFAWSSLNITTSAGGFDAISGDPVPWQDSATGALCVAATNPAGHVITWCRQSDDSWLQWDMTALWGGPASAGVIRWVNNTATSQSNLLYRDASGEMWMLARNADGTWTPTNLTATYGLAPLASDPWPLTDIATGQECAIAATSTPAGHVTEWCHQSNGTWLPFDLTATWGGPAAVGTVVAGYDPAANQNDALFRDASGEVWSLTRGSGGNWVALNITASASGLSPIAADPVPVLDPATGDLCVATVLASPAGHVAALCRSSSATWAQSDLTALYAAPAAVGNVEPFVDPQSNEMAFYYRAADGTLWSVTRAADGQWTPAQITSTRQDTLVSDPMPLIDPQTKDPVIVAATNPPTPVTPSPPVTVTTPVPKNPRAVRARFIIKWHWDGRGTVVRAIRVRDLPRRPRLSVGCHGRGCPQIRSGASGSRRITALLRRLVGRTFAPGDVMQITVTARGLTRERIQLHIRRGRVPLAKLLRN